MDYLQYPPTDTNGAIVLVLNLVINGLPSIPTANLVSIMEKRF